VPWLCRQSDPVGWLCVHWGVVVESGVLVGLSPSHV